MPNPTQWRRPQRHDVDDDSCSLAFFFEIRVIKRHLSWPAIVHGDCKRSFLVLF